MSDLRAPAAPPPELLRWGSEHLRLSPWRGDVTVGQITPAPDTPPPSRDAIAHAVDVAVRRGYREVVTSALGPSEQRAFLAASFNVREHLHLLSRSLGEVPPRPDAPLRKGRRGDRAAIAAVDATAFRPFWHLDEVGLADALAATPASRLTVATVAGEVAGYAISGRAARRGYLQRLAVDPARRGAGLGRALVIDGLRWMRRWGADQAVVNTQTDNDAALALYLALGFRLEPGGLAVLTRRLAPAADPPG
ncbi:MAG: GNAT family N-acetyltransferase [Acidimicrobiales bacterium]|nr:GNAT family N-acetyltransferase [Acidimicrobiales bacterium]